jgi:hypothetical protein
MVKEVAGRLPAQGQFGYLTLAATAKINDLA